MNASRSSVWGEWPLCSKIASSECGISRWISSAWSTGQIQSWRPDHDEGRAGDPRELRAAVVRRVLVRDDELPDRHPVARVGARRVRRLGQRLVVEVERPDRLEGAPEARVVGERAVPERPVGRPLLRRGLAARVGLGAGHELVAGRRADDGEPADRAGWRAAYMRPRYPPQLMPSTSTGPRPRARRTPSMSSTSWSCVHCSTGTHSERPWPRWSQKTMRRPSAAASGPSERTRPPESVPGPPWGTRQGAPSPTTSAWRVVPLTWSSSRRLSPVSFTAFIDW